LAIRTFVTRTDEIQRFLKGHHLQALLGWRPDELLMMSGYLPFWGASVLLYPQQGLPVLFVPVLEPRDHIPAGLRVREYPWGDLKCADPFSVLMDEIHAELKGAGAEPAQVGAQRNASRTALPIQAAEQIPLPDCFADKVASVAAGGDAKTEAAFLELYLTKSAGEVEAIRLASRVAGIGIETFCESSKPGVREAEVAAAVETAVQRQIGSDGIFHARAWAMVQSGPNSADSGKFNRSTGRILGDGDLVLLELATCVNGYWSDLSRTIVMGTASPDLQTVLAAVREAQAQAMSAVGPGASAGEIDAVARAVIDQHGFAQYFTHGTGHHVGFRYHDPGFGLTPGESAKLAPGMVITVEPGVYVPEFGGGARIEDNVLVTQSGHEVLSPGSGKEP
jgi:Xaa-Pro dipeptidase